MRRRDPRPQSLTLKASAPPTPVTTRATHTPGGRARRSASTSRACWSPDGCAPSADSRGTQGGLRVPTGRRGPRLLSGQRPFHWADHSPFSRLAEGRASKRQPGLGRAERHVDPRRLQQLRLQRLDLGRDPRRRLVHAADSRRLVDAADSRGANPVRHAR
eukprot:1463190-Prymnesium_polylepis.1